MSQEEPKVRYWIDGIEQEPITKLEYDVMEKKTNHFYGNKKELHFDFSDYYNWLENN